MPMKQVTYRNDKAVIVRVYVEKNRNKRSSSTHRLRQKEVLHGCGRRAGLLTYSHLLRQSARRAPSPPSFSNWVSNHPSTQIAPSNKKKPEYRGKPTCFGSLKLLIPRFLRSWSKDQNKEKKKKQKMGGGFAGNGMKMLQVWKGKSLFQNMFSTIRKCA
ncbi:hypothetical protein VNO78_26418 [Psophocarpus tetragonolobus]|uniref:Uncharacterized protein n=1 Tax=Psophocarpus tetragonolobus TaxID=3891 RepID=A0AAN9S1Y8_PSOTE